jgi:hypothetical protein
VNQCLADNPAVTTIETIGKGQSPSVNPLIAHSITGHIVDAAGLSGTAHRIKVCAGTTVTAVVTDTSGGTPSNLSNNLDFICTIGGCSGPINVKTQYKSTSTGTSDSDSITFLPQ